MKSVPLHLVEDDFEEQAFDICLFRETSINICVDMFDMFSCPRQKMICLNMPAQEDEPCAWSQCWADGSVWEVDMFISFVGRISYIINDIFVALARWIGPNILLWLFSVLCFWFRGMVVKACFQINTEAIGLDLSQLLFSNRDGLLVVDDFLSEGEVGSKQIWIFWGNEWKHLLILMCYAGGWNP